MKAREYNFTLQLWFELSLDSFSGTSHIVTQLGYQALDGGSMTS